MRKIIPALLIGLLVMSCAPALKQEYLDRGDPNVPFSALLGSPAPYKGKLYILGGLIVETRLTDDGALIEALYVPADTEGNIKNAKAVDGRFLAVLPKSEGMLDPKLYDARSAVTIAGEFKGVEPGRLDGMEYMYPVFEIKEIHVWKERPLSSFYAPYLEANPHLRQDPFWKDRPRPAWR